jgi:GDP-4-dehydro-6-deoxy-D-mannose reductase
VNHGPTLVTGAAGFVGSRLLPSLRAAGREPVGVHLPSLPSGSAEFPWRACDLRARAEVEALIAEIRPAAVVHLAALAAPAEAERDPLEALRSNYLALDALLGALARSAPAARFLFVSTGEIYGASAVSAPPYRESAPARPANVYAATKAAGECRVRLAVERAGLDAVIARPFNHTGAGRPPLYAEAAFAQQIARIERGAQEPVVRVGNLEPVRDFSDVRDVVAAYGVLLESGARGEAYNVGSGRGRPIRAVLDHFRARSTAQARIEIDPARFRAVAPDALALVGDATRLRALGWAPRHPLEETLDELLAFYRAAA